MTREAIGGIIGLLTGLILAPILINKFNFELEEKISFSDLIDAATTIAIAFVLGYFLKMREDRSRVQVRIIGRSSEEILVAMQKVRSAYSLLPSKGWADVHQDLVSEFKQGTMAARRCRALIGGFNRSTGAIDSLITCIGEFRDAVTGGEYASREYTTVEVTRFDALYDSCIRQYYNVLVDTETTISD